MSTNDTDLQNTIDRLEEIVEQQQEQIEQLEDRVEELEEDSQDTRHDVAKTKQRVSQLEQGSGDANPGCETGKGGSKTPLERYSEFGADAVIKDVTPSVIRACALMEQFDRWGKKTPKGYRLKSKDNPKKLLEALLDEDLAWEQYYRACETLEEWTHGAFTFFDHRKHGKMILWHEDSGLYQRKKQSDSQSSLATP